MTLPTNINLPESKDLYLRNLTYALSTYMQQTNQEANGTYITFTNANSYPFIVGSAITGSGTYSNTILFSQRSNNIISVWFDITWAAHTGTGNLWIQLPYTAQFIAQRPFVGPVEASNIVFSAGMTYLSGNLIPNTNTIEIHQSGSGLAAIALPLPASGTLRGSIVYAGQKTN